MIFIDN